ncbi:MAG: sigma-70 family RNA polymerase sigma factor [Alphaproteobacteria bacterium]|nr:sigma-70 family RNA polymerase sigma factor [Alphaproteobacteria bacterium]
MAQSRAGNGLDASAQNELIRRIAVDRDREAFSELFLHYAPRLTAFLVRGGTNQLTAEELTQEVLLTVWRRAESYDSSQATLSTWIFTIARNKRIDGLRRERRPELDPEDPALQPNQPVAADDIVSMGQRERYLRQALTELPEEQADVLKMAYFEEKPHSVIAAETNLPLGTVKSRLRLALGHLRKIMKDAN